MTAQRVNFNDRPATLDEIREIIREVRHGAPQENSPEDTLLTTEDVPCGPSPVEENATRFVEVIKSYLATAHDRYQFACEGDDEIEEVHQALKRAIASACELM